MLFLHRFPRVAIALTIAVVVAVKCGGGEDATAPPAPATLEITTSTSGPEPDADGYSIQIDGGPARSIGTAANLTVTEVTPGAHTAQLGGVAANCTVSGDNPRAVSLSAGETTTLPFVITCSATTGTLTITAATSGPSPDADGYIISIDGADRGPLAVSGAVTITGLAPGSYLVGLSGMAANCQIQGDNTRSVIIAAGANAGLAYTITCETPPAGAGSLRVTTATTGPDPDRDGYTFAIDGGVSQPIGVNATTTLTNLSAGTHVVTLAELAGNCTALQTSTRSITVVSGAIAELNFAVACTATTGTIRVSVATSGSPIDPDGYVAQLDGGEPGLPVGTTGSVTFTGVPAGSHTVVLGGLAANCAVTGGASQTTTVTAGATSELSFSLTCTVISVATRLEKVSGDPQTGSVGAALEDPLVVRVTDASGNGVQGVTISWSMTGGGNVSEASTQSGTNGETSVTRTLGGTAGQQTTVATVSGLTGSPVTFTHTATAAAGTGMGQWDPLFTTPMVGVHSHLLRTGKVLVWGDKGTAFLWSATAGFTPVSQAVQDLLYRPHLPSRWPAHGHGRNQRRHGRVARRRASSTRRPAAGPPPLHVAGPLLSDRDDAAQRRGAGRVRARREQGRSQGAGDLERRRLAQAAGYLGGGRPAILSADVRRAEREGVHGRLRAEPLPGCGGRAVGRRPSTGSWPAATWAPR